MRSAFGVVMGVRTARARPPRLSTVAVPGAPPAPALRLGS